MRSVNYYTTDHKVSKPCQCSKVAPNPPLPAPTPTPRQPHRAASSSTPAKIKHNGKKPPRDSLLPILTHPSTDHLTILPNRRWTHQHHRPRWRANRQEHDQMRKPQPVPGRAQRDTPTTQGPNHIPAMPQPVTPWPRSPQAQALVLIQIAPGQVLMLHVQPL